MDFSRYRGQHPNPSATRRAFASPAWLALLFGGLAIAPPARADNPGYDRPGLGFSPAVLDAGALTVEQGLPSWSENRQGGIRSSQYSADSLLRLGLGNSLELQFGASPWNRSQQTGPGTDTRSVGHGDSSLALKLALPSSSTAFSWGLLANVEFTDGAAAFRNSQPQVSLGMVLSRQLDAADSLGAYADVLQAGSQQGFTVAVNRGHALTSTLSIYAEAAWQRQPGQGTGTVAGGGLAWMASRRVQLDASFRHHVSGQSDQWWAGLGASIYFGH